MEPANSQPELGPDEAGVSEPTNTDSKTTESSDTLPLSRRSTLAGLAGLGGVGLLSGSAQARHGGPHWQKDVDADGSRLFDLGALAMAANPTEITDFAGTNLSIGGNGRLNIDSDALDADTLDGYDTPLPAGALSQLDESISLLQEGLDDEKPESSTNGHYFLATDTRLLYRYDSSEAAWTVVSGRGVAERPVPGDSYFETIHADSVVSDDETPTDVVTSVGLNGVAPLLSNESPVFFNRIESDPRDEFDTFSSMFTAASDGYYDVDSTVRVLAEETYELSLFISVNNTSNAWKKFTVGPDDEIRPNIRETRGFSISKLVHLNEGDRLQIEGQVNGIDDTIVFGNDDDEPPYHLTYLTIQRVG